MDKLKEKIEKLLAHAKGTDNPAEAAVFLEKATALMDENGITQLEIDRLKVAEREVKSTQSVSKPKDWENSLVHSVARAFGCKVLWRRGHSRNLDYWGRFVLVGHRDKVMLAEYSTTFLLRQLVKARSDFSRRLSAMGYSRGKAMTAQLDGFCKGWIRTVRSKVHAFANSDELQALIDALIEEICKGKKVEAQDRGNGQLGWGLGTEAARDVHLHRPMNHEEQKLLG